MFITIVDITKNDRTNVQKNHIEAYKPKTEGTKKVYNNLIIRQISFQHLKSLMYRVYHLNCLLKL